MANGFNKVKVKMPNRSGQDMSHSNFFTATCGTLVPCLVDWLLPNDTVQVSVPNLQVQLPPMVSDFYGYIEAKVELFFVPNRILYGGWQDTVAPYLIGLEGGVPSYSDTDLPYFAHDDSLAGDKPFSKGSLCDYLGLGGVTSKGFDIFPILAYHKIYDDWYRDSRLQKPVFVHPTPGEFASYDEPVYAYPWLRFSGKHRVNLDDSKICQLFDGSSVLDLRQRNFARDLFTNATYEPQLGSAASVSVENDEFTIASLRSANALQQFLERNNIAGNSYQDRIKAHFGVYPSDAVSDRAVYLGRMSVPVYTKGVFQSAQGTVGANPFNSVASKYGSSQGVGSGSLCRSFTSSEHGVLMGIFSLVPQRTYSSGTRPQFLNVSYEDYPQPLLAGIGDEEIYNISLSDNFRSTYQESEPMPFGTFGYTQRYSFYKFMRNEVHGLLVDGESLSSFALQSYFGIGDSLALGSEFIQIPKNYLNGVTAVSDEQSEFGCWVDSFWSYKKLTCLPSCSIPTLENLPLDGHYETLDNGGYRL